MTYWTLSGPRLISAFHQMRQKNTTRIEAGDVRLGGKTVDAATAFILSRAQETLATRFEGARVQILSDSSPRVLASQPCFLLLIEPAQLPERSSGHCLLPQIKGHKPVILQHATRVRVQVMAHT